MLEFLGIKNIRKKETGKKTVRVENKKVSRPFNSNKFIKFNSTFSLITETRDISLLHILSKAYDFRFHRWNKMHTPHTHTLTVKLFFSVLVYIDLANRFTVAIVYFIFKQYFELNPTKANSRNHHLSERNETKRNKT